MSTEHFLPAACATASRRTRRAALLAALTLAACAWGDLARGQAACAWNPVPACPVGASTVAIGAQHLYAAGPLVAGGPGQRVARFDGAAWTVLTGSFNGAVRVIAETSLGIAVGGEFTQLDGQPMARVALFDGTAWLALGSGIQGSSSVRALAQHNGELYAGGKFTSAGGVASSNVARFDGVAWHSLAGGVAGGASSAVEALLSHQGELLVGGSFTSAGVLGLVNLAAWDGIGWHAFAPTTLETVYDLKLANGEVHAAARKVYRFVGGDWQQIGAASYAPTGLGARALAVAGGAIYAVGTWDTFCLSASLQPCLAAARFANGLWALTDTNELDPSIAGISAESFQGLAYRTGSVHALESFHVALRLIAASPQKAPWYQDNAVTLVVGCYDAAQPASIAFGSLAALPVAPVDPTHASVQVPAGYLREQGPVDLTLSQAAQTSVVAGGFAVLPALEHNQAGSTVTGGFVNVQVLAAAGPAVAQLYGSQAVLGSPLAFAGVHGLLALDPAGAGLLKAGAIGTGDFLQHFFAPGALPPGFTLPMQAVVVEFTGSGTFVTLTNSVVLTIP